MKFFISHASKDSEIAKYFSIFLSNLNVDVEVFCSSISGMINQGDDFVKVIEKELKDSDVFIPLISNKYLDSKYCMIELGYAYSKFVNSEKKYYIFPFCVPPVTKAQALNGTPLAHIQTEPLNGKDEIHNFIRVLMSKNLLKEVYIKNEMINDFINKINNLTMNTENILDDVVILPICSDQDNLDAIQHTIDGEKNIINFNLFANRKKIRPDFISLVLKFPGTFNFYDFLRANAEMSFICTINNYTGSLTDIDIEFKYHETHQLLKSFKQSLLVGKNEISIPIRNMNIEGLKQISEICFVAWNKYIINEEGMFTIENIQMK